MISPLKIQLRGVSQVFLVENALAGLLFLIGIGIHSWRLALCAIAGTYISTVTARLRHFDRDEITSGIYGFNGTLAGIAIGFYYGYSFLAIVALIVASILSTLIMRGLSTYMRPLTSPFIFSVWFIASLNALLDVMDRAPLTTSHSNSINILHAIPQGIAQVMFQGSVAAGIFIIFGLCVRNKTKAFYAIYGSLIGMWIGLLLLVTQADINAGLFGFNAVLCAVALGRMKTKAFLITTVACIVSTLLYFAALKTDFIILTAPFVVTAWIVLAIEGKLFKSS